VVYFQRKGKEGKKGKEVFLSKDKKYKSSDIIIGKEEGSGYRWWLRESKQINYQLQGD